MEDFKFKNMTNVITPKNGEGVEYLSVNGFGTGYQYIPEEVLQYCADNRYEIFYCNAERAIQGFVVQARRIINNK